MTTKTPQQKIAELEEKKAKLEAALKEKRKKLDRAKRRELAKIASEKRKKDTRRKILVGAAIINLVSTHRWPEKSLVKIMNQYLTRHEDRELFGLGAPSNTDPESESSPKNI